MDKNYLAKELEARRISSQFFDEKAERQKKKIKRLKDARSIFSSQILNLKHPREEAIQQILKIREENKSNFQKKLQEEV